MKILVTGCTDTHINKPDRAKTTKFLSIPELYVAGLKELGHEVEHRAVNTKEDLDQFDKVFCFLYPMDRHARHPEGALHILRTRKDAIIALDDWSYLDVIPTWEPVVGYLRDRLWLAPVFNWGDVKKLGLDAEVVGIDPSPMVQIPSVEQWQQRIPAWIHASFHRNSHLWVYEQAKWQVLAYGCKEYYQPRILEDTVIKLHGVCAGSIQPPYAHVGAGWWRVRTLHAMENGTVIGCHPKEFNGLSPLLEHRISTIEAMDSEKLRTLAENQALVLRQSIDSREEFLLRLRALL